MDNIIKGTEYEIYINNFLNSLELVKKSYLWKDVPEYILFDYNFITSYNDNRLLRKTDNINKLEDIGTDIIYINQDDECIIVQCKNYSKTNPIRIEDLSGFWYIMCDHSDKIGEIYYTNKICKKILNKDMKRIKLIKKEMINKIVSKQELFILYNYQKEAIELGNNYYENNSSGIISQPCGTGKTIVAYNISIPYKIVIMITPLRQYAQQNCDRFKSYDTSCNRKILLIDTDGTRDVDEINKYINSEENLFLSVTYKSCDIINQLNFNNSKVFIIFDEFHNFSENNIYNETDEIYKLINLDDNNVKKLYLSATPRIYDLENDSMNDIDVNLMFGDYIYKMSFNDAINNKYISNYELYLPIFSDSETNEEIKVLNIDNNLLLKLQFLIEAIKMTGTLKMIIYLRNHEEIDEFISNLTKLNEYYSYDLLIQKIICDDSYSKRNKIIEDFNNSTQISLLLSVHILDEAIDIPTCNSIYMTYVSSSKIKNIQRMCRAMRYKPNKIANIFLYCNDLDESLDYISSIKEYDTEFITRINYVAVTEHIKTRKERIKINQTYLEENRIKILGIKVYQSEKWEEMLEKMKIYIDNYKKSPNKRSDNYNEKKLGLWCHRQKTQYNNNDRIMKNEYIRNLWKEFNINYKKYFIDNEELWNNNLIKVKEYIDKYNKKPTLRKNYKRLSDDDITSDTAEDIIKLSDWLNHQISHYKNNTLKNKNEWLEFINDNKYKKYFSDENTIWYESLDKLILYINEHKKKPTRSAKNNDETKKLASWTETQEKNYKSKTNFMENEDIFNSWSEFINENCNYFNSDFNWNSSFEKVQEYKSKYNKLPSKHDKDPEVKKLGEWILTQNKNYKNKTQIMSNEIIYNKWKNFI